MRIAFRELTRRPGRFLPAGGALTLLVVLLLVLGAFLDGLTLNASGTLRAQSAELVTFSDTARRSLFRSQIAPATAQTVAGVDGVASASGLGINQVTATVPDGEVVDVAVVAYESATDRVPAPPAVGEAIVDRRLTALADVAVGDTLALGRGGVEVTVAGWVEDTAFQQQPSFWVAPTTWRQVVDGNVPGSALPEGVFQALVVEVAHGADVAAVADAVDAATGTTDTVTLERAILSLPGVEQQQATFTGIIGVTFAVAGLVVALFFALLTLERVRLYAVLKAVGARSSDLFTGVAVQAVAIATGAVVVGGLATLVFVTLVPADLPVRLEPARLAQITAGTLVTAVVGASLTLRRILRVEPAQAIG